VAYVNSTSLIGVCVISTPIMANSLKWIHAEITGSVSNMKLTLTGRPITKKNSQQIVLTKTGRRYVIQSKQYLAYEKDCLWQIIAQRHLHPEMSETIIDKINLQALYYMPDKRIPDLLNLLQATADILEKARVIDNDKDIVSFDGSMIMWVDKANPRTEITIERR